MIEAGAPSTGKLQAHPECARPTGGSHVRTTRALALLMAIGIPLENTNRAVAP
jgi:hypothetical protein